MLVRCSHCGYQNNEHYRFCGMCGALLRLPDAEPAALATETTPTPPQHPQAAKPAPSPAPNLDYLLEDEPEDDGPRRRMYLALVLLAIAGVVLVWQFTRGGESRVEPGAATTQAETSPAASSEQAAAAAAPDSGPATAKDPSTTKDTPPPALVAKVSPQEAPSSPTPEKSAPTLTAAEKPAASTSDQPQQPGTTDSPPTPPAAEQTPAKDVTTKPTPAPAPPPKTAPAKPTAAAPTAPEALTADSAEDKLVAAGEKYLYGNGVAENCAVAQKNLRAAAQRSNAKAQSILGTMYATGHCVDRDLPMAYRWFAKALHQEPSNNRIQRDLEVLWRQMTADERQLAIRP